MDEFLPPLALRRRPRPATIEVCDGCGEPRGARYPNCPVCYRTVEAFWLDDWQALLDGERIVPGSADERLLAEVVLAEVERHAWTVVNIAMTLVRCPECGGELGGGELGCTACASAFGNAMWSEARAGQLGLVTGNEHALHVGRFVLRHPQRYPAIAVAGMRWMLPRLLTGWLPAVDENQRMVALGKAGHLDELQAMRDAIDQRIGRGER